MWKWDQACSSKSYASLMHLLLLNWCSGKTASVLFWLTDATLYKDFQVRSFDQKKYLSPLKAGFSVTPEEDIRDVKEPTAEEEEKNELLNDVHVVGARVASLLLNFPDSRFTTSKFYWLENLEVDSLLLNFSVSLRHKTSSILCWQSSPICNCWLLMRYQWWNQTRYAPVNVMPHPPPTGRTMVQ